MSDLDVNNINFNDVPTFIDDQFKELEELSSKVEEASEAAEAAKAQADKAKNESAGLGRKKTAIEKLQYAESDTSEALVKLTKAQTLSFEYQKRLAQVTQGLFQLGISSIAMNRIVVQKLNEKLQGASQKELDERERQEILNLIKQLKDQEDFMVKQDNLSQKQKELKKDLEGEKEINEKQDIALKRQAQKDVEQDKAIRQQIEKDKEHDFALKRQEEKDEKHEDALRRHAEKNKEQDKALDELSALENKLNNEIQRQAQVDVEHDRLISEIQQKNAEQEVAIQKLSDDTQQKYEIINEGKSNKNVTYVAIAIAIIALIMALVQFFV